MGVTANRIFPYPVVALTLPSSIRLWTLCTGTILFLVFRNVYYNNIQYYNANIGVFRLDLRKGALP